MKLLVVVPYFPYASCPYSGAFNERTVQILMKICECVEVLVPRPYTPKILGKFSPRWRSYANIPAFELRNGVPIYRPGYFTLPKIGEGITRELSVYLNSRTLVRKRHEQIGFDAIVSFDLFGAGSLAWRIGKDLGIPACGWGTGADLAQPPGTMRERVVQKALNNLDLVFYQSHELLNTAATILGIKPEQLDSQKHNVLARGIGDPPLLKREHIRNRLRTKWGIGDKHIVIMSIGRAVREKGVFEFLRIVERTRSFNDGLHFVWVGGQDGFDDGEEIRRHIKQNASLAERVRFFPACPPDEVWQYLCAADIFVFPSHHTEGMPNSLLEAMVMGVPAVAFGMPSVREIEAGTEALVCVKPYDTEAFSQVLLRLAAKEAEREKIGIIAREQVMKRYLTKNSMVLALAHLAQLTTSQDMHRDKNIFIPRFLPNK